MGDRITESDTEQDGAHDRGGGQADGAASDGARNESPGPDWLERAATWISGAVVLAVVTVLAWDALHADRPASIEASVGTPRAVGVQWHVPIKVRNTGDVAVQKVDVNVALEHPDTTVQDLEIEIDWLPGRSQREVDAVFRVDPSRGKLTAEVQSFDQP